MLSQHVLGAGVCLSCALGQQNTQISWNLFDPLFAEQSSPLPSLKLS